MGFVPLFVQDFGSGAMERMVGSLRCFVHPGEMGLVPLFVQDFGSGAMERIVGSLPLF